MSFTSFIALIWSKVSVLWAMGFSGENGPFHAPASFPCYALSMRLEPTKQYVLRRILDEVILVPISARARDFGGVITLNAEATLFYWGIKEGKDVSEILASFDSSQGREAVSQNFHQFVEDMKKIEAIREISS